MAFLNIMPASVRAAYRRFYLNRELEQAALNRRHCKQMIGEYLTELHKIDADEALIRHKLATL